MPENSTYPQKALEAFGLPDLTPGRNRSISYRRTAPIDMIRRVRTNEALLVYGRELPAQLRLRPWFEP